MENPRLTNALTAVTAAQTRNGVVMSTSSILWDTGAREPGSRHTGKRPPTIGGRQVDASSRHWDRRDLTSRESVQLAPTSSSTLPPRCTWATASLMADKG